MYNKDEIKYSLTLDDVYAIMTELGAEPKYDGDSTIVCRTICHNPRGQGSYKLYYYNNSHLFHCYSECNDSVDIFDLVKRVFNFRGEFIYKNGELKQWELFNAIEYVAQFFGIAPILENTIKVKDLEDWKKFKNYDKIKEKKDKKIIELQIYDSSILSNLLDLKIEMWEKEGITEEILRDYEIKYDPYNMGIVIPHYDINNNLIGIRERTIVKENEKYGKYMPATINYKMYSHPLSYNLYGINKCQNNIEIMQKAIIAESEKSVLLYDSYFGKGNGICVACCGSAITDYQINLLLSKGVKEIIIAFDKDFVNSADENYSRVVKKLTKIYQKYGQKVQVSFLWDTDNLLGLKDSPLDRGKDIFLELFKNRVVLN